MAEPWLVLPPWLMDEIREALSDWGGMPFTDLDWDAEVLSDGRIKIEIIMEFEEDEDGSL